MSAFQDSFDAMVSPELRAQVERCCEKYDLLSHPQLAQEVVAILVGAAMLEEVEAGRMEITGFKNGSLIFEDTK